MVFKKNAKRMDILDLGLTKWASIVFALFAVSVWPAFANWVTKTNWIWFLAIALILGARPLYRFFKK
ncbi:hypothetical protein J4423_01110 [Candidatus Pacearchaeota archaeon]|nr:hypothetical protein [Candidatus Pacearchaeota archaeon]